MTLLPFKDWLNRKPAGRKARKRIPKVSKKREGANREYSRRRKAYLARGICEAAIPAVCTIKMVEIHHAQGRGINLNNTNTWVGVCRDCHNWIHANPSTARLRGLLK